MHRCRHSRRAASYRDAERGGKGSVGQVSRPVAKLVTETFRRQFGKLSYLKTAWELSYLKTA